jgi:hypothetical protein
LDDRGLNDTDAAAAVFCGVGRIIGIRDIVASLLGISTSCRTNNAWPLSRPT